MPARFSTQARRRLVLSLGAVLCAAAVALATSVGPDVTVFNITDVANYTTSGPEGGFRGYALGTDSCNVGDQPVWWCDSSTAFCTEEQHPVIAQNLYRLEAGRFEQIGMSWLKHGFFSLNSPNAACNPARPCGGAPHGGAQLGIGCTDVYGGGLNGSTPLGMRSEVNATTGQFPFPYTPVGTSAEPDQRVKVLDADVDIAAHPTALYWAETQYVAADDAAANNGLNNASYRSVSVGSAPSRFISVTGSTVREKTALHAWKATDPAVEISNADFTSDASTIVERFEGGLRATDLGGGLWHYEAAIRNMNSKRAARGYTMTFPPGTTLSNPGAHVISHHSGEPYTAEDWDVDVSGSVVTWSTDTFAINANANALRWGTTFTFRIDADHPPENRPTHMLTLFEPGTPNQVPIFSALFSDGFERGLAWAASFP